MFFLSIYIAECLFLGYAPGRMRGNSGGHVSVNVYPTTLESLLSARGEVLERVRLTQDDLLAQLFRGDAPLPTPGIVIFSL